ncbi:hypothetical protein QUC31_012892 [Theobroma cacao]
MSSPPAGINRSWFRYFQFEESKDSPSQARNDLLVVFTLIATVTFQAGVTPPGGVWQDDTNGSERAGRAIYASQPGAFYVFLISNTVAFATSIFVIVSLTHRFPFQLEIRVAAASMLATYASAIFAITPEEVHFRYVLIAVVVPFVLRFLVHMFTKFTNRSRQNPSQFLEFEIPYVETQVHRLSVADNVCEK